MVKTDEKILENTLGGGSPFDRGALEHTAFNKSQEANGILALGGNPKSVEAPENLVSETGLQAVSSVHDFPIISTAGTRRGFPEQPVGPLFQSMSAVLISMGFGGHLRQAAVVILALISAWLGIPITLLISSDPGADAFSFLHGVSSIIPEVMKREIADLSARLLHAKPDLLQGKSAIVYHADALKKSSRLLQSLFRRSTVNDFRVFSSGGESIVDEAKILGSTSFIGLTEMPIPGWLAPFQFLHEHLRATSESLLWDSMVRRARYSGHGQDIKVNFFSKDLERLQPKDVRVSFIQQIVSGAANSTAAMTRIPLLLKLLELITIVNRAASPTVQDVFIDHYNLARKQDQGVVLQASKVEFYLLGLLFPDLLVANGEMVTEGQKRVFEAILRINKDSAMGMGAFLLEEMEERIFIEYLDIYDTDLRCWASIIAIKEEVNRGRMPIMTESKIRDDVNSLVKRGVISRKKMPGATNKFVYAVATFSLAYNTTLPSPREIFDPIFGGREVEVLNILTGETEII